MLIRNRIFWNIKRTQIITIEQTNGSTLWAFLNSVKEIWVTWNSHEFGVCRNNWMVGWTKGYGCLALPKRSNTYNDIQGECHLLFQYICSRIMIVFFHELHSVNATWCVHTSLKNLWYDLTKGTSILVTSKKFKSKNEYQLV